MSPGERVEAILKHQGGPMPQREIRQRAKMRASTIGDVLAALVATPLFGPNAPLVRPDAPLFGPNAPLLRPNAPRFRPNAPLLRPNEPRFRPNAPRESKQSPL